MATGSSLQHDPHCEHSIMGCSPVRGCSLQMEIQTYPDNLGTGIYGNNIHIDNRVYRDCTSDINFSRAYSNNYVLSSPSLRRGGGVDVERCYHFINLFIPCSSFL